VTGPQNKIFIKNQLTLMCSDTVYLSQLIGRFFKASGKLTQAWLIFGDLIYNTYTANQMSPASEKITGGLKISQILRGILMLPVGGTVVSAAFIAQTAFKGIFKFSLRLTEKLT
jgi:hypothetical protein